MEMVKGMVTIMESKIIVINNNIVIKKDVDSSDDEDLQEEVMKNVVSSKGKFASFLQMRNTIVGSSTAEKQDPALKRASMILSKNFSKSFHEDLNLMVNPKNVNVNDKKDDKQEHEHTTDLKVDDAGSLLTPLLLLTALSLHGFFEGMAMGFQGSVKDTLFLGVAILAHKWAEAFTLGISFTKAGTDKRTFLILILIFSLFTPFGIILGLIFPGNGLLEGIVLGLSTGTFIYVAASEVIVEEFAVTKYKFQKFLFFLIGGIFVGILAMIERFTEDEH
jgi:zinc transporter ZupT